MTARKQSDRSISGIGFRVKPNAPIGLDWRVNEWHLVLEHGQPEVHRLLPFCEPSLVIRRRFDREGRALDCRLLISPAIPDGGRIKAKTGGKLTRNQGSGCA
jgi:hypothetical protein